MSSVEKKKYIYIYENRKQKFRCKVGRNEDKLQDRRIQQLFILCFFLSLLLLIFHSQLCNALDGHALSCQLWATSEKDVVNNFIVLDRGEASWQEISWAGNWDLLISPTCLQNTLLDATQNMPTYTRDCSSSHRFTKWVF